MFGLGKAAPGNGIFGLTHCGHVRDENEDAIDWWSSGDNAIRFGLLADGMGGHAGGAFASKLAIQSIKTYVAKHLRASNNSHLADVRNVMKCAVEFANHEIHRAREDMPEFSSMGTTVVFVAVTQGQLFVLHAGDSRCYVLDVNQGLQQITRDDSVVQAMLEEGVITEADIPNIPYRNKLTNALGIKPDLELNIESREFQPGEVILLCSDGFYHAVELKDVANLLSSKGVSQETVEQLLSLSLDNHTDDNTSVLLISGTAA